MTVDRIDDRSACRVFAALLPPGAVAVAAFDDRLPAPLFPAEERLVDGAISGRRREFATVRRCAREALAALGRPAAPLLPGPRGAPVWPAGVVGSLTHCAGYRAAAVAPDSLLRALGIDAEPHAPLPVRVLVGITGTAERAALDGLDPGVRWDRLLFCAKEAVYKAWSPLTRRWLGFRDVEVRFDAAGGFTAELLVTPPTVDGRRLRRLTGRWWAGPEVLVAAVAVQPAISGS